MKSFIITSLRHTLATLAGAILWRYKPAIIGVTGSVGKTSTKRAIEAVLRDSRSVRAAKGNLNNEIGLPLNILGEWSEEELKLVSRSTPSGEKIFEKIKFWLRVIFSSLLETAYLRSTDYPEILVLEYGADRPKDIKRLVAIARPNVSVITAVGDIPAHVEFYPTAEDLAREKARLIECLSTTGYAVLNADDPTVMNLESRTRAHIITFGFSESADVRMSGFEQRILGGKPAGISFKLNYGGAFVPVRLDGVFGRTHAYAAGAAAAVGIISGVNLVKSAEGLKNYRPASGRMELIRGVKSTFILNDCYNASPLSMAAALETLSSFKDARRVAVLGDMLELGPHTLEAHEKVGKFIGKSADLLITVGARAKFIADSAMKHKFPGKNILSFETSEEAALPVQNLIREGDVVLVKASRGIALDRVVEEIRYIDPEEVREEEKAN